jgi:ElaA protein
MDILWQWLSFEQLTPRALHDIMRLRQEIFVVEQACAYLDIDGSDPMCLHLLAHRGDALVAYLRLVPPQAHASGCPSLGRICTAASVRTSGLGRELVTRGLSVVGERYPQMPCQIGAQSRLRRFYESFGFVVNGDEYDEDGILHWPMRRPAP